MKESLQQKHYSTKYGGRSLPEEYDKESTEESKKELINFIKWCKKKFNYTPTIIGGWAVYAYAGKEQSIDIDTVFHSKKESKKIMNKYFKENNYEKEELHDQQEHFVKIIKRGEKNIELRFDYYDYKDKNSLVEDSSITIPWKLIEENHETKKIKESIIRIPSIELLLIFKVKALRDRDTIINTRGIKINEGTRLRIKSKIEKDKRDIKDLINTGKINEEKLNELLEKTRFTKYLERTVKEIKEE